MVPTRLSLPIDPLLPQVVASLKKRPNLVLQAPTGAGKTTRLPPALWDAEVSDGLRVVVLEPRRLAARAAARRMAQERGESVGESVGHWVRWDKKWGPQTQILVVTEGIFVAMLQHDPFLEEIGVVVFDEFHERSLQADLALGLVRNIQQEARPDLKIVVMSATLAPDAITAYLDCPSLTSEGRSHPVAIEYLSHTEQQKQRSIPDFAAMGVKQLTPKADGDILVFLPGVGEIRRTADLLKEWATSKDIALHMLFGSMSHQQQDDVLATSSQTKVILSTNVAETSLTIEGIRAVVDTGWARVLRYDPATGLNRLELSRISRASATQRSGRAGRTAPGICLRLWTETQQHKLIPEEIPEIRCVDLSGAVLELLHWGEQDIAAFSWLTPPSSESIEQARLLLQWLEATDLTGKITRLGHAMARLPLHPRLARLLLAGQRYDCPSEVSLLAAMLSERDVFLPPERHTSHPREEDSLDILDRLQALQAWADRKKPTFLSHRLKASAVRNVLRVRDQLLRILTHQPMEEGCDPSVTKMTQEEKVRRALLLAYPDRVARRRQGEEKVEPRTSRARPVPNSRGPSWPEQGQQAIVVGGKGLQLPASQQPLEGDFFVCIDITAATHRHQADWLLRQASPIRKDWLPETHITEQVELVFDNKKKRVSAYRRRRFADLILSEVRVNIPDAQTAASLLAQAASQQLDQALNLDKKECQQFLARLRSLSEWMPELNLPRYRREEIVSLLPLLCAGKRSFAELRKLSLVEFFRGMLPYHQQQALAREAPERIEVPSGSHVRVHYEEGRPPVLAVRIQEMFGQTETPCVAGGRIPVLLHLLAPNMRPQQVTQDLANFWQETYRDVRKELRQRYPKHAWPEDPTTAKAERRPQRRRHS